MQKATPNMAQVEEVYITPTLGSVVRPPPLLVDAKCLEFCGLPYMVLLCLAHQHINRSWTLLRPSWAPGATKGETNALEASALVQSTLNCAGFVAHATKSIWKPTQRLQWLGFVVGLSKGQIEVPEDKLAAVKVKLQKNYQSRLVSAKHLASVEGSIISMSLAIGPVYN